MNELFFILILHLQITFWVAPSVRNNRKMLHAKEQQIHIFDSKAFLYNFSTHTTLLDIFGPEIFHHRSQHGNSSILLYHYSNYKTQNCVLTKRHKKRYRISCVFDFLLPYICTNIAHTSHNFNFQAQ